jgi:RNA-directed DNA polymerase
VRGQFPRPTHFSIYTKSEQAARNIGNNLYKFLRDKLKLPINREKSGIRKPMNFTILGYSFVPTYVKGENLAEGDLTNTFKNNKFVSNGKYQLVVSERSWKSLKEKLKAITRKTTPMTFDERIQKLKETSQGWLNYFRLASIQGKLKELDGWLRNRLRYCIWHNWNRAIASS